MRALSPREWRTIIIGGALVAVFLIWSLLISPGRDRLEANSKRLAAINKALAESDAEIKKAGDLAREYKNLTERYSNALETITPQKMPDNLSRTLREEFGKLDQKYQSSITSTAVKQPQTNDMYSFLPYQLKDVKCDWKSLNAALKLIEGAGQLVGFDSLKIRSNLKDPASPQAVVDLSVQSYTFNDDEDKNLPAWRPPDYDSLVKDVASDIFSLPEELAKAAVTKGRPVQKPILTPDGKKPKPSWAIKFQLTGINQFGNRSFAMFYDKSARVSYAMGVGSKLPTTEAEVYVTDIDSTLWKVTTEENGEELVWDLYEFNIADITQPFNNPFVKVDDELFGIERKEEKKPVEEEEKKGKGRKGRKIR